jgi:hypothetical protein
MITGAVLIVEAVAGTEIEASDVATTAASKTNLNLIRPSLPQDE